MTFLIGAHFTMLDNSGFVSSSNLIKIIRENEVR
jgi:hypothetical protein